MLRGPLWCLQRDGDGHAIAHQSTAQTTRRGHQTPGRSRAPGTGLAASADLAEGDGRAANVAKMPRLTHRPTHGCVQPLQLRTRNTPRARGVPSSVPNTTISTEPPVENSAAVPASHDNTRMARRAPQPSSNPATSASKNHVDPARTASQYLRSRQAETANAWPRAVRDGSDMAIWSVMATRARTSRNASPTLAAASTNGGGCSAPAAT